ncbi:hypothetical protein [Mesorhizobium humile]|uniref:Uncharacterized protein n=1 Tax=Mesorhizobium humile TaxID=3072313 RepID=A0ABU4YP15_9HYPH|nr:MULTISPECIES: hypothetical protein [unclassified Mesorhizobium]MDX8462459.1 hypothetical protein [Mesorhizobium sp. VK2D]MDX8487659.1 hypothetical protein [Mesorhizobium sp. VK2B]
MSTADRRGMLDRDDPKLSIRAQCEMLGLSRSGVYRQRAANDNDDLVLMRRIDEHMMISWILDRGDHSVPTAPFLGSRQIALMLSTPEAPVNRKRAHHSPDGDRSARAVRLVNCSNRKVTGIRV